MNIKKIGLTALAASLVSVSANAGEMTISGAASVNVGGYSGDHANKGTSFTMGNQFTVSGGGELDNGLNISMSYQLDNGTGNAAGAGPFDDHSITISSDEIGTIKFSGHGGSSATSAMDATAAGDLWGTFDEMSATLGVAGLDMAAAGGTDNSIYYTAPSLMDGLTINASYNPQSGGGQTGAESEVGYGFSYTGVEGLTLKYATADKNTGTVATSGDQTAWHASYVFGPVTLSATGSDYDMSTSTNDQDTSSYAVSYTLSDEISVKYGQETHDSGTANDQDAEYQGLSVSYVAGGMTVTAKMQEGENIDHSTNANADVEYWMLGAAFAF
jgi:outer membrane protein OmpU